MRIYIKILPPPSADQRRAGSSERSAQPANRTKSLNLGSKKDSSGSCWTILPILAGLQTSET